MITSNDIKIAKKIVGKWGYEDKFWWMPIAEIISKTRLKLISDVRKILVDEINLAHTTKSGKTSRLTSAYNRISELE